MTILGIDPGTINCGYAIIKKDKNEIKLVEAGLIKIKEKILQHQIMELVEGLDIIFKNHEIDEVVIEDMFYEFKGTSGYRKFSRVYTLTSEKSSDRKRQGKKRTGGFYGEENFRYKTRD